MNGIHDLGGMHGFGRVIREENEPIFHADWERRVFALFLVAGRQLSNLDATRHAIERIPPERYLASTYYERWLYSLETRLVESGIATRDEIDAAQRKLQTPSAAGDMDSTVERSAPVAPEFEPRARVMDGPSDASSEGSRKTARFKVGDQVIARNLNPPGHTRSPRYVRGHRGTIFRDWGAFALPDSNAHGLGANRQHCYSVGFSGRELWGTDRPRNEHVFVDLWEDYLEPVRVRSRTVAPRAHGAKTALHRVASVAPVKQKKKLAPAKMKQVQVPKRKALSASSKAVTRTAKKTARPRKRR